MSKAIKLILVFTIITITLCKENWQCNHPGNKNCKVGETCCEKIHWLWGAQKACMNTSNAICCKNTIDYACQVGYMCNPFGYGCLKLNPKAFLEKIEEDNSTPLVPAASFLEVDPAVGFELVKGFFDGFGFFKGLPHEGQCLSQDKEILKDIVEIIDILKDITKDSDLNKVIMELLAKGTDLYSRYPKLLETCKPYEEELKQVYGQLLAYVSAADYVNYFTMHTVANFGQLIEGVHSGVELTQSKKYYEGGVKFGETLKLAFFWDVKH